jgi:hypothetical protein
MTLSITDTQNNNAGHSADCCYAECRYAECHGARPKTQELSFFLNAAEKQWG